MCWVQHLTSYNSIYQQELTFNFVTHDSEMMSRNRFSKILQVGCKLTRCVKTLPGGTSETVKCVGSNF